MNNQKNLGGLEGQENPKHLEINTLYQEPFAYADILAHPRHVSPTRPRMSRRDRAAQFSPFAALTGYDAVIRETGRQTDQRAELTESRKEALDERLQLLREAMEEQPTIAVTWFKPDERKEGGSYETTSGPVRKLDVHARLLLMRDGTAIPIDDIYALEGNLFSGLQ